jgi:hypothetical protein
MPSNMSGGGYLEEGENLMREDRICNALIWLMAKLVNFMAAGDEFSTGSSGVSYVGVTQRTLLDYWHSLAKQFEVWHNGLPIAFEPTRHPSHLLKGDSELMFIEVWYSIPMCASIMQMYHMSQILLHMNKPHESTQGGSTVCARLNSYQSVLVYRRHLARPYRRCRPHPLGATIVHCRPVPQRCPRTPGRAQLATQRRGRHWLGDRLSRQPVG